MKLPTSLTVLLCFGPEVRRNELGRMALCFGVEVQCDVVLNESVTEMVGTPRAGDAPKPHCFYASADALAVSVEFVVNHEPRH